MDASKLEMTEDATTDVEIFDANGQTTGIFVTVYSADSEVATSFRRRMLDRRLSRMARRGGKPAMNASEIESEAMDMRVLCTKSWKLEWNGKPLDCNDENKRMIYTRVPLIKQQVDDAISDASLFTKG